MHWGAILIIICVFQENTILGASNDFASRVWSLTDQRVRVGTNVTYLLSEIHKLLLLEAIFSSPRQGWEELMLYPWHRAGAWTWYKF